MTIDQDIIVSKLKDISLSGHAEESENTTDKHHVAEPDHQNAKSGLLSERESEAWQRAIEKVIGCVVSIKFSHPHNFDTEVTKTSEATGFVVDVAKG